MQQFHSKVECVNVNRFVRRWRRMGYGNGFLQQGFDERNGESLQCTLYVKPPRRMKGCRIPRPRAKQIYRQIVKAVWVG